MNESAEARNGQGVPGIQPTGRGGGGRRGAGGCGSSASPHVASLSGSNSNNHGGSPTTTLPKGNPTQLLDQWASCMRTHGDPNQVDPTIDANKVIHITFPPNANPPGVVGKGSDGPCDNYLTRGLHGPPGRPADP